MSEPIETIEYKDYQIQIYQDEFYDGSPRDWDNLGTITCWHRSYQLGEKHNYSNEREFREELAYEVDETIAERGDYWENGNGWVMLSNKEKHCSINAVNEADERINKIINDAIEKHYIILPIYMYDHSGITINTTGFSCPWDSGQVGYIYVSKEKIRKEYNKQRISKQLIDKVTSILIGEIETYDQYLRGDVYGYNVIDPDNEDESIDSCWGFYGSDWEKNGLMDYAKPEIDYYIKKNIEKEFFSQFFF